MIMLKTPLFRRPDGQARPCDHDTTKVKIATDASSQISLFFRRFRFRVRSGAHRALQNVLLPAMRKNGAERKAAHAHF